MSAAFDAVLADRQAPQRSRAAAVRELVAQGVPPSAVSRQLSSPEKAAPVGGPRVQDWRSHARRAAEAERDACRTFNAQFDQTLDALRATTDLPALRAAMLWQNPRRVLDGLDRFTGSDSPARHFKHARTLVSYLQRYCAKNDTIGFFGPRSWATLGEGDSSVHVGEELVRDTLLELEFWAADSLRQIIEAQPNVRPYLYPRLHPTLALDGQTLYPPTSTPVTLDDADALLLGLCDGKRTVSEIVAHLRADAPKLRAEARFDAWLERRVLICSLDLPIVTRPLAYLRGALEPLPKTAIAEALESIDALENALDAHAGAIDDPHAVAEASAQLAEVFRRATGKASHRFDGETYAGRTLTYIDCTRDLDVELGPSFWNGVATPLSFLMDSARWMSHQMGTRAEEYLVDLHRTLGEGEPEVPLGTLLHAAEADGVLHPILVDVAEEHGAAWDAILADAAKRTSQSLDDPSTIVTLRSDDLVGDVERAFEAPGPGWPDARIHAPDLLLCAPDLDAVARGEFSAVLGEIHPARNTLLEPVFARAYSNPAELAQWAEHDVSSTRFTLNPRGSRPSTRLVGGVPSNHERVIDCNETPIPPTARYQHRMADLFVQADGETLWLVTDDENPSGNSDDGRFPINSLYNSLFGYEFAGRYRVGTQTRASARIVIDQLVVRRATWRFESRELDAFRRKDRFQRHVAIHAWVRETSLPRYCFASVPHEPKPWFVDFQSPLLVELLVNRVRPLLADGGQLTISEMLPGPEGLWLKDRAGNRYTSELRFAVRDARR